MLRTLAFVGAGLAVAVAAVLIYTATRPDTFRVARSAAVAAPPERIYPLIADMRGWTAWSPYEAKDPAMKRSYEGAASGKGAVYAWDGNRNVGKGRMEVIAVSQPSRITIALDMISPMEAHNVVDFTLEPKGAATEVTWAMRGESPYIAKLIGVFLNMDEMIGKDFEAGLANLKRVAEDPAGAPAAAAR